MEENKCSFLIFCVLCLVVFTSGFLPNHDNDFGNSPTASNYKHDDITESALLRVIARLLEDTPKPDGTKVAKGTLTGLKDPTPQRLFDAYYGKGQVLARKLQESIETVVKFNAIVDKDHRGEALFHFNGEQIKEGFEKLSAARELFKGLVTAKNANFDVLRRLLGVLLHMIQDFYSNTNWIEMKGPVVYQDLGIKGKPILPVASPGIMTCQSCTGQCRNNIILTGGVLTSGYRTGQDIQKPDSKFKSRGIGKCSHGGESDADSKVKTATGGINKETTVEKLSPHYYLHSDAGKTAVRATEMYIDGQGIGLRQEIGDAIFRRLFQLSSGNSLVFVIDTTGSMSGEIAAVKQITLNITRNTKGQLNAPSEYILATFNDPANLTEVRVTNDSDVMESWLRAIKVKGGGDCPEYMLSGMIEAVKECQPDSLMFVFTDADPKDPERTSEFIALATAKRVSPKFFRTGKCSKRRKREVSTGDVFAKLSDALGGTVFTTSKDEINDTVKIISLSVEDTAQATLLKHVWKFSSQTNVRMLHVDHTVALLSVRVRGLSSTPAIKIINPEGIEHADMKVVRAGNLVQVYNIKEPPPGVWKITRVIKDEYDVSVTGHTTLDFTYQFLETVTNTGNLFPVHGQPLAGENTTILISLTQSVQVAGLAKMSFVDRNGLLMSDVMPMSKNGPRRFIGHGVVPVKSFSVMIWFTDNFGHVVKRQSSEMIAPSVSKPAKYYDDDIYEKMMSLKPLKATVASKTLSSNRTLLTTVIVTSVFLIIATALMVVIRKKNLPPTSKKSLEGKKIMLGSKKPSITCIVSLDPESGSVFGTEQERGSIF